MSGALAARMLCARRLGACPVYVGRANMWSRMPRSKVRTRDRGRTRQGSVMRITPNSDELEYVRIHGANPQTRLTGSSK